MSEFDLLGAAASGMEAQRSALGVYARNVAASQAVPDGTFERLVPRFAVAPNGDGSLGGPEGLYGLVGRDAFRGLDGLEGVTASDNPVGDDLGPEGFGGLDGADRFGVFPDEAAGSPGADPIVRFSGVARVPGAEADSLGEMVAVLDAQRAFEADASLFDLGKHLAERTIDLGRS